MIRDHVPEGLTIIFEGKQRKGKTLSGVIWALDAYQQGRNIFSNIQLGFPHSPIEFSEIKLEDGASKYWNGFVLVDEWNFFFDSRKSMRKENVEHSSFLLQQKKQGCTIAGTTHDLMSLDVRLRENFDYLITPEVYPAYPAVPQTLRMKIENGPLQSHFKKSITLDCRPFLGLYDSFAVYDPYKNKPKPSGIKPRVIL